jgi:hypothetical protein
MPHSPSGIAEGRGAGSGVTGVSNFHDAAGFARKKPWNLIPFSGQ